MKNYSTEGALGTGFELEFQAILCEYHSMTRYYGGIIAASCRKLQSDLFVLARFGPMNFSKSISLLLCSTFINVGLVFSQSTEEDYLETYDKFCEIFNQNYASFEEKGIDWATMCAESRSQITSSTTDDELFEILTNMLSRLNDGHVSLRARDIDKGFDASRSSRIMDEIKSIPSQDRRPLFFKMTEETLYRNGFEKIKTIGPKFRDEPLFHYTDNGRLGYLRFTRSFSTLLVMKGPKLNAQLNQVFKSFQNTEGLIIDVRFNMGGTDEFSEKIVSRLIDEEIIGYYKQTRKDGEFGELTSKKVKPKGKTPYNGQVVLLTNDVTVSAADVLALMMSQLPQVTIIGECSNGSFSDLWNRKLPNGWRLTLSNQRYLSSDMKNYEGLGLPVDIEVLNMLQDIEKEEDSVLNVGLELLNN